MEYKVIALSNNPVQRMKVNNLHRDEPQMVQEHITELAQKATKVHAPEEAVTGYIVVSAEGVVQLFNREGELAREVSF